MQVEDLRKVVGKRDQEAKQLTEDTESMRESLEVKIRLLSDHIATMSREREPWRREKGALHSSSKRLSSIGLAGTGFRVRIFLLSPPGGPTQSWIRTTS